MLAVSEELLCHHCGEACEDVISFDDHSFCCFGCRAVYELITTASLDQYYQNDQLKAKKVDDRLKSERKYSFLDLPEVVSKLYRYEDKEIAMVKLYIAGIHCSSCIYLLEHLPKINSAIIKGEVNFVRKEVSLTFRKEGITLKEVVILLSSLGYSPQINLDSLDEAKKKVSSSSIGLKIAVAGFCFGNSMLISLPEYLDVGFQLEDTFKSLFGWINLGLSLPVLLYSSSDYFKSSFKGLRYCYLNIDIPIAIGIITLFVRSVIEIITNAGPGYIDSLTGLVFFLLIGKWYQGKSYAALAFDRDYTSYFPISATRISKDGTATIVVIKDLKAGDRIQLHSQELLPADGVIVGGVGRLDYSFVTGEADPVDITTGQRVFAGGRQVGGSLDVVIEKAVDHSELTQLWNSQGIKKSEPTYRSLIDRVSQYFTIAILILAFGSAAYWYAYDPTKVWETMTAVLIVACPCALALAMPFGLGHGMRVMGSWGLYLKNAEVIERLAKIKSIVFDKTGTLTKNNPEHVSYEGSQLSTEDEQIVRSICSNSAHPLSKLVAASINDQLPKLPLTNFNERVGQGVEATVNGIDMKLGSADFVGTKAVNMTESSVYLRIAGEYKGKYIVASEYREHVFEELSLLKQSHQLHLLSGDNDGQRGRLANYFDSLHFGQRPQDKLSYLREMKGDTLMIGDGLNDAGALNAATVGLAVCEDIHQFSPACDGLLKAENVSSISRTLRFSKSIMNIIIVALVISLTYNVVGLAFAITGHLTPVVSAILMPISSVSVVGFITLAVNVVSRRS
ncbi:MAG: Cu+-exporting ATPase [Marinoscillum sp.]|jgi:Cu+-exporting ATPase